MRAALLSRYDKDGQDIVIRDVPVPEPRDGEVLVRVRAAGVNPLDTMIIRGEVRPIVPYRMPLVMGNEFCGIVEATGSKVTGLVVGERVYGRMPLARTGAFADYLTIDEQDLAPVPDYLDDEEAASVPLTALTAIQALDLMQAQTGRTIFIAGGTGNLGAMAIPIAKSRGLRVVTNGSAANRERVLAIGADRFIDYRTEDYASVLHDVDYVLDTLGGAELKREFGIMRDGGHLVTLRGIPNGRFAKRMGITGVRRLTFSWAGRTYDRLAARHGQTYDFLFVHEDGRGLSSLDEAFDASNPLPTSVDAVFDLEDVNKALEKVRSGHSRGKTVLRISA